MKERMYECDCGSVAIECGGSIIKIPNGYGDGYFKVIEFENEMEFNMFKYSKNYLVDKVSFQFLCVCDFENARLLAYDCLKKTDNLDINTLCILNGTYAIYNNRGEVYFIKW